MNGVPRAVRVSDCAFEILPSKNDLNLPSSNTAAGIPFDLNFSSSGAFLFSFKLIIAGVPILLELADDCNRKVFLMPSAFTVSIGFTNLDETSRRFLLIG